VTTGLSRIFGEAQVPEARRRFLIQGNVENRRDYGLLERVHSTVAGAEFTVIGLKVNRELALGESARVIFDADELAFHRECAACHFVLPLINPQTHKRYFEHAFSTSILIGFAYGLPFVAHRALFELYGLEGFAYADDAELAQCLQAAVNQPASEYDAMRARMSATRERIVQQNLAAFAQRLAEARG
jgi:hypothetical protein